MRPVALKNDTWYKCPAEGNRHQPGDYEETTEKDTDNRNSYKCAGGYVIEDQGTKPELKTLWQCTSCMSKHWTQADAAACCT